MPVNLRNRHLISLKHHTPEEINYLLDLSTDLKNKKRAGIKGNLLERKNVALIFEKPSTRTRCAFTVAAIDEGGHPEYLGKNDIQLGHKEDVADTARVLGRMFDGIEFRGFSQQVVEDLAKYAGVPVWNGLTDDYHPTQVRADFLTIRENFGRLKGIKLVYVGDGRNNVANSLMIGAAKMGMHFVAYGPKELADQIDHDVIARAREVAEYTGATIEVSSDEACLKGADVLYTDIRASMGEEDQIPERVRMLTPFKVTKEMLDKTENGDVIFMHCLPSFHDFDTTMAKEQMDLGYDIREVTDEVFLSRHSKVFDEAENRMHTIKAVMVATMG